MRQHAGRLNRPWLFVIGLIMVLAAAVGALIATDRLSAVGTAVGVSLPPVEGTDRVFAGFDIGSPVVLVVLAIVGALVGVLGLLWAVAQVPRKNEASVLRFDRDADLGVSTCAPRVICRAVEDSVGQLPDVNAVSAVLRGTSSAPELTLDVTASDEADLAQLLGVLRGRVATDLSTALDAPLALLAVALDVEHGSRVVNRVVL